MNKVNLTAKQREYWRESVHRWNFKVGATRSGKTFVDYFVIPRRIMERKNESGLSVILGNTRETIRRNIVIPMQEIYGAKRVGNIRSDNSCFMFGERVFCLGADNVNHVDRLRGTSIKYCYGDEVATWHPEVFDMLKSRLDKPYSCFDGALNPQSPNHWLKGFLDSDADIYDQHYTIFDNPFLPQEFVDNLCKEYAGTVYYKRYILGEWALAEGLIYPMYDEAIAETPLGAHFGEYCVSCDYGTLNAFAALLWAKEGGIWRCIDEYYYSGRENGMQKTDGEYAEEIEQWLAPYHISTTLRFIVDPSAASFITLIRKTGKYNVLKADNDVSNGIREVAEAIRTNRFKIDPRCKNLLTEMQGYVWDDREDADVPMKINDHACDALRYFVKTMRIAKAETRYSSMFGR